MVLGCRAAELMAALMEERAVERVAELAAIALKAELSKIQAAIR